MEVLLDADKLDERVLLVDCAVLEDVFVLKDEELGPEALENVILELADAAFDEVKLFELLVNVAEDTEVEVELLEVLFNIEDVDRIVYEEIIDDERI